MSQFAVKSLIGFGNINDVAERRHVSAGGLGVYPVDPAVFPGGSSSFWGCSSAPIIRGSSVFAFVPALFKEIAVLFCMAPVIYIIVIKLIIVHGGFFNVVKLPE